MAGLVGGASKSRYELRQNSAINVTPFVDVMLVLLIVMMAAVPAATLAIRVDAPPVLPHAGDPPTFVSISGNGSIQLVNGAHGATSATLDSLAADLTADLGPDARRDLILVRANRDVRYGAFMGVLSQLNSDGFDKVSVIVEDGPAGA